MTDLQYPSDDPFLLQYQDSELRVASEFLTTWVQFLSKGLCGCCTDILYDRIRSLSAGQDNITESLNDDNSDTHSLGSWKEEAESNSLGSLKNEASGWSDHQPAASSPGGSSGDAEVDSGGSVKPPIVRMSWADMAQEDEVEIEEEGYESKQLGLERTKTKLTRDQREYLRFMNVKRKKDFIYLERVKGKPVNILQGLELHTGVFSAAEQKRIVDYIYDLKEMGRRGELKERTYTAPRKWMRGKGRQTIQFGCCYNYAMDKNGNPPGILQSEMVDPIPPLFKVIIKRLVSWHVLPPSSVPDSCIVNIYEEGDCIPPHIDNHDFVRPFCTISFLSECDIVFGTDLKAVGPGEFTGVTAIPLPVGSVLVLNGNGADVAKHCVPAVPTKRISITFRRMDESKRPIDYVPEPDLQGLEPLCFEDKAVEVSTPVRHNSNEAFNESTPPPRNNSNGSFNRSTSHWRNSNGQTNRRGFKLQTRSEEPPRYSTRRGDGRHSAWSERGPSYSAGSQRGPSYSTWNQRGPSYSSWTQRGSRVGVNSGS